MIANQTEQPASIISIDSTWKFRQDMLSGLNSNPKKLYSKYFYDAHGDLLFQEIMASPEYYLTRCEREIFQFNTAQLADMIVCDNVEFDLIELGAGDATKSQYLLEYLTAREVTFTYMPIDISGNILSVLKKRLASELPELNITSLHGEYFDMLSKVSQVSSRRKVLLFLGGNIGNMNMEDAQNFCQKIRTYLNPGDFLLIGFDLKKHPRVILNAYNDSAGITARFNLNLLTRINRELDGNFNAEHFEHYQTYHPGTGACESYLVSLKDQTVTISGAEISFHMNETIFMEISQKYTSEQITNLESISGFSLVHNCLDAKGWFVETIWKAI